MTRYFIMFCFVLSVVWTLPVWAGDTATTQPAGSLDRAPANQPATAGWRAIDRKLDGVIAPVNLQGVPAKQAFAWWSQVTGVDLDIHWAGMEEDGIDPQAPITLEASQMNAGKLLRRIMAQVAPTQRLIFERTDDAVQVMTRTEANRHRVVRMYDIADLLPAARNVVSGVAVSGGGGGASASSLLGTRAGSGSSDQGADEITRLIREMVETDVWRENGGESTMDFYRGHLIVRAPLYVQVQIGRPVAVMVNDGNGAQHRVVQIDND